MKRQSGFTLIELIIVIVILGILAVTVAPQFFNFGSDARAATVRGLEGAVRTASELVHARAHLGQVDANGVSATGGGYVLVRESDDAVKLAPDSMYAEASEEGIWSALNLSEDDWTFVPDVAAGSTNIVIYPEGFRDETGCSVSYTYHPQNDTRPTIGSSVENC